MFFSGFKIRTDQSKNPVRFVPVCGPAFLAIDQEVIPLVFTLTAQASQVGASARFTIALAPADFAPGNLWQMFKLVKPIIFD